MKTRKRTKNTQKHCHSTNNRTVRQIKKHLFRIECELNLTTLFLIRLVLFFRLNKLKHTQTNKQQTDRQIFIDNDTKVDHVSKKKENSI